jgi:hypothetical protein
MSNQKWYSIAATVTKEQKQEIEKRAESSGMTVNEYIKARLFIDEIDKTATINKISNLDKWMIKVISYIVANVEAISQRTLSDQQYNQLEQEAATIIKRSGFIKEDEIFSTKPKN